MSDTEHTMPSTSSGSQDSSSSKMEASQPFIPRPLPAFPPQGCLVSHRPQSGASPTQTHSSAMLNIVKQKLDEVLGGPENSGLTMETQARQIVQYYSTLIPADKHIFVRALATDYNVDQSLVLQLAQNITATKGRGTGVLLRVEDRLRHALVPKYQPLFTQISRLDHGVKFLVDMRTDILNILMMTGADQDNPHLQAMNSNLRDLLSLWFSVGFLHLERITWESPCDMLQKISDYEAVHPIRNWTDLKRRVGPYRRCFVYTHSSMPREPVVVLHTALTSDISEGIQEIVNRTKFGGSNGSGHSEPDTSEESTENPDNITTAIFYSITSTQKGLQGVELGNYLIKSVVKELATEFPNMHQFSSLSPIPGFKEWLIGEMNKYISHHDSGEFPDQALFTQSEITLLQDVLRCSERMVFETLRKVLQNNSWVGSEAVISALHEPLMRICARYLYTEKRRKYALNPVANFHLRNGAVLWRINWLADRSPRGLGASCGMMVNYRYFLHQTEENSQNYVHDNQISASELVLDLIKHMPVVSKVDR